VQSPTILAERTEACPSIEEQLQLRIHGDPSLPTLVYLPGLHGDWTLIGRFREALAGRLRFVEITYPRTLTWSLDDYAAAVENALEEQGIERVWLLGESFSSQVVWPLLARKSLQIDGVVLAGGFVRHPIVWGVRLAERLTGALSLGLIARILFGYARLVRWRHRKSPAMMSGIQEFLARRTKLDQKAAQHRLHILAQNDPCAIARSTTVPMYAITGLFDPIVPWFWVRRWLRKNCTALRQYKIIPSADHNVLGTGAQIAADQIVKWVVDG